MIEVTMPRLGETVTEGTLVSWFKQVGDPVDADELLFEVSTDKVDTEITSPGSGFITSIVVPAGETVAVGTVLATIADATPDGLPSVQPLAQDSRPSNPSAPGDAPTPAPSPGSSPARTRNLSPLVRRLMTEAGIAEENVTGTGSGGRITRDDVHRAAAHRSSGGSVGQADQGVRPAPPSELDDTEVIPFTNIRRRTAEHMVRSKATSPHTLVVMEVDYHEVDRARRATSRSFKEREGFSLTYLPFIARAVLDAITTFPRVNASVEGDSIRVYRRVNLGIAVDMDFDGLIVPVVADAGAVRLEALARTINKLAVSARNRRLSADDLNGGTFTISNAGGYGTLITAPIINQPQVAIIGTEGVRKRAVVLEREDGDHIAIRPTGNLSLTWDHRAFDGAYASAFLARVRQLLETRNWFDELQ